LGKRPGDLIDKGLAVMGLVFLVSGRGGVLPHSLQLCEFNRVCLVVDHGGPNGFLDRAFLDSGTPKHWDYSRLGGGVHKWNK
jgi:hypothetical protein